MVANGQFRPKITWFSLAAKVVGNMPYYEGSKTFGDIVFFLQELTLIVAHQNLIYKFNLL